MCGVAKFERCPKKESSQISNNVRGRDPGPVHSSKGAYVKIVLG